MSTKTMSKTEQRELEAHGKLREQWSAAYADVETSDHASTSAAGVKLARKRDRIGEQLQAAAAKLMKRGYQLRTFDSAPIPPTQEDTMTDEPPAEVRAAQLAEQDDNGGPSSDTREDEGAAADAKPASFEWPTPPRELLLDYLTEQVSTERSAPNEGKPFITEGGVLRIRAEHWREWLQGREIAAPKLEAGRPIRELGYSMKPYPLPGEDRAHGFYTGPLPTTPKTFGDKLAKLPRRKLERATRAPRPFGKLSAEQAEVLGAALTAYEFADDQAELAAVRDALLEQLAK